MKTIGPLDVILDAFDRLPEDKEQGHVEADKLLLKALRLLAGEAGEAVAVRWEAERESHGGWWYS